jgi:hypothetical protein
VLQGPGLQLQLAQQRSAITTITDEPCTSVATSLLILLSAAGGTGYICLLVVEQLLQITAVQHIFLLVLP